MRFLHPMMCGTARSHTLEDPLTLNIITLKGLYTGHVSPPVYMSVTTLLHCHWWNFWSNKTDV